MFKFNIYHKTR